MIKRILSLFFGIGLVAFVVFLGLKTGNNRSLVIWFGLASAILVPIGLAAVGYAFTSSNSQILERLSKVPEIEKLISEAKSQEEKVRLLEQERLRLVEIVELEARKQSLATQKESLEQEGIRILKELEAVDVEMSELKSNIESSPAIEEIKRLQARLRARKRGDLIIRLGSSYFTIRRVLLLNLPYGGMTFNCIRVITIINNKVYELMDRILRIK